MKSSEESVKRDWDFKPVVLTIPTHKRVKQLSRDLSISIKDLVNKAVNKLCDEYER